MLNHFNNKFNEHYWCLFNKPHFDLSLLSFFILANLSNNSNITTSIINNNIDKYWDWWTISNRSDITWDFINKYINKPFNWYVLSYNNNITFEIIKSNLDIPWSTVCLSKNHNITFEIIKNNPEISPCLKINFFLGKLNL